MGLKETEQIRIAYVIGQLTIGGTERQLVELVRHLDRTRYLPVVICLSGLAPLAKSFRELGCMTYVLGRETRGRFRILWQLYRILRDFKPDIVHAFAYASRAAVPVAKLAGKAKNIVSIRTQPDWQVTRADRLVNNFSDLLLANSETAALSLRSIHQLTPCRIIYNGLDIQKFDELSAQPLATVPATAAVNLEQMVICAVSRLNPVKCLDVLLAAHAIVLSQIPGVQLWLIGDGSLRNDLEQLAAYLGISANVVFWGMRTDVPSILQFATVGVLSSRVEGLSNAIIEYMAAGLPVVSTKIGGNPELVLNGQTGLLVPPDDPKALAASLVYVFRNSQVARQFGETGRCRIIEHFSADHMVSQTERVYEELLG